MPGQAYRHSWSDGAKFFGGSADAIAIALRLASRRAGGAILAIRKVAAERQPSGVAEGFGDGDQ